MNLKQILELSKEIKLSLEKDISIIVDNLEIDPHFFISCPQIQRLWKTHFSKCSSCPIN